MTVGIYIRVSTREQVLEGYSIDAQKENLVNYCKSQGWNDYKFYVDEGISAKDTNRPQLQLLMKHIEERQINMILVYRLDRFTRSVTDLYQMLDAIDKHDCTFKSATEIYDTSSAMGRMFIGLVALLAQWERENMGERIEVALVERARQLKAIGVPPFGYKVQDERYVIDEEQEGYLRHIIDAVSCGTTVNALSMELNRLKVSTPQNGEKWYPSTLRNILRNPALYGGYYFKGETVEDAFTGYITKSEWLTLQEKLDGRKRHHVRGQSVDAAFRGVLDCPKCGYRLNPAFNRSKKTKDKLTYMYRCTDCRDNRAYHKSYSEKKLVEALTRHMSDITFNEVKTPEPVQAITDPHDDLMRSIEKTKQQRLKYQRIWSEGIMKDEEFYRLMAETEKLIEELERDIQTVQPVEKRIDWETLKELAWTFNQTFNLLEPAERSAFISKYIKSIRFEIESELVPGMKRARDHYTILEVEFYI